jgi:hypothetical protein
MALSTDIKTILTASSSLVAVVAARIYPVIAPEKPTLPCVVYSLEGHSPTETKTTAMGWDDCIVSVSVIATKLEDAETYGNLIRTAMNRYTGAIGSDKVKGCNLTDQRWVPIADFSYQGAATGVMVFAVEQTFKLMVAQNISE